MKKGACNFKTTEASVKSWFRTNGLIDDKLNILDLNGFRKNNTKWSNYARQKYGIEGRLFFESDNAGRVYVNKEAFRQIDNAKGIFYQVENTSTESPIQALDSKLSVFFDKLGVSVETIYEGDFVARAKIIQKIIEVVQGRADVTTLPEEASHFFVELLDKNSSLYRNMFNQIEDYQIYRDTYEEYKDRYFLENGDPDIDRIKREAIAKLISQHIVNIYKNNTKLAPTLNWFERAWNVIIGMINKALKSIGLSGFTELINAAESNNSFEQSAQKILSGEIKDLSFRNLEDKPEDYEMLQAVNSTQESIVKGIKDFQSKIERFDEKVGIETIHGYYINKGTPQERKITVTPSYVAGTDKRRKNRNRIVTADEESLYSIYQKEGTVIHSWAEDITMNRFSAAPVEQTKVYQSLSARDKALYNNVQKVVNQTIDEIKRDDPGAIFLPEVKLYDPSFVWVDEKNKKHVGMAGSIDLLVVHTDGTVSIYDWKTVNKAKAELNIYKYSEYSQQVALYKRMLMNGNFSANIPKVRGIKKTRLLPLEIQRNTKTREITGIKFFGVVPIAGEHGENERLNNRIEVMYERFHKLLKAKFPADPAEKTAYINRLENIRDMLIVLQLKQSYDTILEQAMDDLYSVNEIISKDNVTASELQESLELVDMYVDIMDYADTTAMNSRLSEDFKKIMGNAAQYRNIIINKIEAIQKTTAETYGIDDLLKMQEGIGGLAKTFRSISQFNHPMIAYLHEMVKEKLFKTEQESNEFREQIISETDKLNKWAKSRGLSLQQAYDKLVNKSYGGLISVFSKDYRVALKKAKIDGDTEWFKENMEIDKERAEKEITRYTEYILKSHFSRNQIKNKEIQNKKISDFKTNIYDIKVSPYAIIKKGKESNWYSEEWKELNKKGNEELLSFYNFFTENTLRFAKWLPSFGYSKTFIPNTLRTSVEELANYNKNSSKNLLDNFKRLVSVSSDYKQSLGMVDQNSGEQGNQIPVYFINPVDPTKKSYDLGRVLQMFGEMSFNHKNMSEIEGNVSSTLSLLKTQKAYEVSSITGKPRVYKMTQEKIASAEANKDWIELYEDFAGYFLYGIKTKNASKITEFLNALNNYTAFNMLGLSVLPAFAATTANIMNTSIQAARNEFFNTKQLTKALWALSGGTLTNPDEHKVAVGFLNLFQPNIDNRKFAKDRNLSSKLAVKALSSDHFFVLLRKPDEFNQSLLCLAILQNSTFDEKGNIVLIKNMVRKPVGYYDLSTEERKKVDTELEEKRKSIKSVYDMGKIVDGKFIIEGHEDLTKLTDRAVMNFRQYTRQVTKNIIGNVDQDDISGYRLIAYARSLMLFRNWMPRSFDERYGELRYNRELQKTEWGRYRTLLTHLLTVNKDEANKLRWAFLMGVEKAAKLEWTKRVSLDPQFEEQISLEDFIELYKSNMKASYRGLTITAGLILLIFFSGKYFNDDDDLSPGEQYTAKVIKRAYSEMAMFVNPLELINILKSPAASTAPLITLVRALQHSIKEVAGLALNDEEMIQKAHPLKYWMGFNPFVNIEKTYRAFDKTWLEAIEDNKTSDE